MMFVCEVMDRIGPGVDWRSWSQCFVCGTPVKPSPSHRRIEDYWLDAMCGDCLHLFHAARAMWGFSLEEWLRYKGAA